MSEHPTARPAVVVGVDGSDSALRAVDWAAGEATRRGAPLRLVTAFSIARDHVIGYPGLGERYAELMRESVERQLHTARARVQRAAPALPVTEHLVTGFPIGVLNAEAKHAELVVIGNRGLGGIGGLLLGSVAHALAAHAPCPVVVVRGDDPTPPGGPVVVGVDGSPVSEAALAYAYEAAAARGADLVAVHAWSEVIGDIALGVLIDWDAIASGEEALLSERLAGWEAKYPDVTVHREVVRDGAAHAVVARSQDAQLVVVGSRGHGSATGLLLGSVSHAVLHRSHCPVVVVRPPHD